MQIEKFENEKWKKFWKARNKISKNFFLGGVCQKMFKQNFFFFEIWKTKTFWKFFRLDVTFEEVELSKMFGLPKIFLSKLEIKNVDFLSFSKWSFSKDIRVGIVDVIFLERGHSVWG